MTSIIHDYKAIGDAARKLTRSFDWYPTKKDEPIVCIEVHEPEDAMKVFRQVGHAMRGKRITLRGR